jgi:signal transduction histidine kinase
MFQDTVGRIWLSGWHPAGYLENGRFVAIPGVPRDPDSFVGAIVEDDRGDIWLATRDALVHLRNRQVLEHIPWSTFRPDGQAAYAAAIDREGDGLWLGFLAGSVVRVVDGRVQATYAAANGLGTGRVHHLRVEADGTVWAATQGGLSRISNGQVVTLGAQDGLPCNEVLWSIEDDVGSVWLFMSCGLVRVARASLDAWTASIGKEATQRQAVPFTLFGSADGIRLTSNIAAYAPQVTKAPDGRIWFSTIDAVSILDPREIRDNRLAPPVHIEQLTADRKSYDTSSNLRLPPLVRDLQISYTALSLVTPERNRFRVMLEGRDLDWQDVGTRRQVFYNDLPPGTYRFRVIAANNSGVWNEAGTSLNFFIAPAYYQTAWFRFASVVTVLGLLVAAYRFRVAQIAREFKMRVDERVHERTRIARELHDTLLQSFQGLILRFQSARDLLPTHPAKAVDALDGALDRADQAIAEGRDAIQNLRSSTIVSNELGQAITTLAEELNNGPDGKKGPVMFRMSVEGSPRDLHPIVRDDIHRIALEALRNAFRHSGADRIEAEVTYGARELRLRIRDDGKGIDPQHVSGGRTRHWGLAGMRERAAQIGAQLDLWSEAGAGTELELRIPGAVAYTAARGRSVFRMLGKQGNGL